MSMREIESLDMSFGAGPRSCIGRNLAMGEMSVFMAELIRGYDIEVHQIPESMVNDASPVPLFVPEFMAKLVPRENMS